MGRVVRENMLRGQRHHAFKVSALFHTQKLSILVFAFCSHNLSPSQPWLALFSWWPVFDPNGMLLPAFGVLTRDNYGDLRPLKTASATVGLVAARLYSI